MSSSQSKTANANKQAEQLFDQMLTRLVDRAEAMKGVN
jgi:hypothetical protein